MGGLTATFVGRTEELGTLGAAVAAPPSVVVIEGEAGIGKTRLVRELREHPALGGRPMVVGACRAIKEPFPLGPVLDAVRGVRDRLRTELLSPVAGGLRTLLPELADGLPPQPEAQHGSGAARHQLYRALLEVLASCGPLVVVLEDLHWADEWTVDLLRYLFSALPSELSLVLTMRAEEAEPAVRALAARLPPPARRVHIRLAPLDEAQTGELAASQLGTDEVTDEFAASLRERTGGLPFAIEEVIALLRDRGAAAGQEWSSQPALAELAVPAAVRDHVLERVSLLPAAAQLLVDVVAAWQAPAPEALVAQVAGQPDEVAVNLSHAIRSRLLADDGGAIAFRHVLAAEAVYARLPGPRRRELHHRIASTLRVARPEATGEFAHHLHEAGRLAEWAVAAERAAEQASDLEHFDEAARLLEEVLRQAPVDADAEVRLAVKLGWAVGAALRPSTVADLLAGALRRQPPRAVQGELQYLLAEVLYKGNLDEERRRALLAEAAANTYDRPEIKAPALLALLVSIPPSAGYAERNRLLAEVLALAPDLDDPYQRVNVLGKVGVVLVAMGDPRWREVVARVDAYSQEKPSHRAHIVAYESISRWACYAGHHREAERLLGLVRSAEYLLRDEKQETFVRLAEVLLDYCCGRWEGLAERVPKLLHRLNPGHRAAYKLYLIAGDLALARGDLDQAEQSYATLVGKVVGDDGADLAPMLAASRIRLALAQGDTAAALAVAEQQLAQADTEVLWPAIYRCLPWLAEVLARAGRGADVDELAARYAEPGREAPLAPAALAFVAGFARTAAGDSEGAAASFLAAAREYDELSCPFESAQARESAAGVLVAAGRVDAAAEPLRAASAMYEGLGATRDLARAARTARQHGVEVSVPRKRGPRPHGSQLTPREREVAGLAATGRSNQDIADQLFVSGETVKKHLTAAMRKLGVRSRAALAHRLAQESLP